MPQEGKSFISANLAVTMAHAGMKVLLIDCDFRHPCQHQFFNVHSSPGLIDFINNGSEDESVKTYYSNLFLFPIGYVSDGNGIFDCLN